MINPVGTVDFPRGHLSHRAPPRPPAYARQRKNSGARGGFGRSTARPHVTRARTGVPRYTRKTYVRRPPSSHRAALFGNPPGEASNSAQVWTDPDGPHARGDIQTRSRTQHVRPPPAYVRSQRGSDAVSGFTVAVARTRTRTRRDQPAAQGRRARCELRAVASRIRTHAPAGRRRRGTTIYQLPVSI